jgi:hypothetical protein
MFYRWVRILSWGLAGEKDKLFHKKLVRSMEEWLELVVGMTC